MAFMSKEWPKYLIYFNMAMLIPSVAVALLSLTTLNEHVSFFYHVATFSLGICFCIDIVPLGFGVPARHDSSDYVRSYWLFFASVIFVVLIQVGMIFLLINRMNLAS